MIEHEDNILNDDADERETELNQLIDASLNNKRPDRYLTNDRSWMDSTVDLVAAELKERPRETADLAREMVHRREGQATRRANSALRKVAQTGTLPDGWGVGDAWQHLRADLLSLPLSLGNERVRLGAASAADLVTWADFREKDFRKRELAESDAWEGARMLAMWLLKQGAKRVEDIRLSQPKK